MVFMIHLSGELYEFDVDSDFCVPQKGDLIEPVLDEEFDPISGVVDRIKYVFGHDRTMGEDYIRSSSCLIEIFLNPAEDI